LNIFESTNQIDFLQISIMYRQCSASL